MSTITKELAKLFRKITNSEIDAEGNAHVVLSPADSLLINNARIALASLEAEPYGYVHKAAYEQAGSCGLSGDHEAYRDSSTHIAVYTATPAPVSVPDLKPVGFLFVSDDGAVAYSPAGWPMKGFNLIGPIYGDVNACHAAMLQGSQPVSKREQVRREHAEWSDKTFGDVGPVGPLKHLSKEALEAAAEPDDLSEWADMQFLLWDAQRRAGISDGEITAAMEEKLKVNMARQWPEPKDGEPRQHLKPAPQTVPDSVISAAVNGIMATYADNAEDCREMVRTHVEQACRAAIQESGHG